MKPIPMSEDVWNKVKEIAKKELCNKRLFVVDAFCGANKDTRMAVRFIMEVAWQAHFVENMFIKPTDEELANFKPDFVVYNASKAKVDNFKELGLNSETCVAFNITSREQKPIDQKTKLEKEKNRLEKTIAQLQQRLDFVEESLEAL